MTTYFKRIALIILTLALTLVLLPGYETVVYAAEPAGYGYSLLKTQMEKTAYKAFEEGIQNLKTTIEIPFVIDNYQDALKDQYVQQIVNATHESLRMVLADHPEFFWFDGSGTIMLTHNSLNTFTVSFQVTKYSVNNQTVTKSNINQYIQQVEAAANKALKDMPTDRDLAKIHYLHDYLAENIDYVFTEDDQTIWGSLVEGQAVCAGYSRAYQYLLNKAGIKCWYITGYSISPSTMNNVAHAWNLVYLDGKCYYTDVTWDDQDEVFHAYYMLSLAEISDSHFPDHPEDLPASCGHKDLDYFEVHKGNGSGIGMLTGSYNASQLAACMKKTGDTWTCHVEDLTGGGPQTFVTWLKQNEQAVASALGIKGGYRWSISTLWDEYQITFEALPNIHTHDSVLLGQAAKNPTCTESGNIGYFICRSCGAWFKNWNGTDEIFDKDSVKIPALEHTYNKQLSDEFEHWKVCKDCGLEQMNSRASHYDNNKNGKCDVCNAKVEVPTEPPTQPATQPPTQAPVTRPTTAPTTPPTTPPTQGSTTQPSNPTVEPTVSPSEQPSTEAGSEPSEDPSQQPTDEPVTTPTQGGSTEPSEGITEPTAPSSEAATATTEPVEGTKPATPTKPAQDGGISDPQPENDLILYVIIGGAVALFAIIIAIVLITKKKK